MDKETVISSFSSPNLGKNHRVSISRIKAIDYGRILKIKDSRLRNHPISIEALYVNEFDFCISHAMLEEMSQQFKIINAIPDLGRKVKFNDWELLDKALKEPKWNMRDKILELAAQSATYRLRFPHHFEWALGYIAQFFNSGESSTYGGISRSVGERYVHHLRCLCESSSPFEVYRLFDIRPPEQRSQNQIKLWELLALQFACGEGGTVTNPISDFVARFQFFHKFSSEAAKLGIDRFKRIHTALLHRRVEVADEEIDLAFKAANTHRCFSNEAKAITCKNQNPQATFRQIINKYMEYSERKDEGSARSLLPFFKNNLRLPAPRGDISYPKFTSLSNAIVHVYKHNHEISRYTRNKFHFPLDNPEEYAKAAVGAYSQMINEVISQATSFSWGPGQFGGLRITFSKDRYRAIVSIQPEGFSYLLTCH